MRLADDCPEQVLQSALARADREFYPAGTIIAAGGAETDRFWYLGSGRLKVSIYTIEGFEKIVDYGEPGHFYGDAAFFRRRLCWTTLEAIQDSVTYAFREALVEELITRNPGFIELVAKSLAGKVRSNAFQAMDIACKSTQQRVVDTLLELATLQQPAGDGEEVCLHLTHEQLARTTATSRATVTAILNHLAAQGLLRKHKGQIVIPHARALSGSRDLWVDLGSFCTAASLSPGAGGTDALTLHAPGGWHPTGTSPHRLL